MIVGILAFCGSTYATSDSLFRNTSNAPALAKLHYNKDSTWNWGGLIGLNFSQVAIGDYWAAGGLSSYSFNGILGAFANYEKGKWTWDNNIDVGYGIIKQGDRNTLDKMPWLKSDDKLEVNSKVGHKIKGKKLSLSILVNFKSQMAPGFNFPNDSVLTSNFLAPGYLVFGAGLDYKPNKNFSAFISPVSTGKITFVNDQRLADQGAFGVDPAEFDDNGKMVKQGSRMRLEFGGFIKMMYKKEKLSKDSNSVFHDISFQTNVDFFSNYLDNPQNIDVNWSTLIGFKVNEFITATITTNLIYDHDVNFNIEEKDADGIVINSYEAPRTQFKEALGIGFSYKF